MVGVTVNVRSIRCGAPIYIEVPTHCFPFRIPPSPSFPFSSHLPTYQDKPSLERGDSQGRVTFCRAFLACDDAGETHRR